MATRDQTVDILEEIALLLELKGENPFKVRAYRTGAETVRAYPGDIMAKAAANDLGGIKGIGDALAKKLHELATTGRLEFHEKLRAEFPDTIFELFSLPGLGAKRIKTLHEKLGIASVAELKSACEAGQVETLPGFAKKTCAKILDAIAFQAGNASLFLQSDVAGCAVQVESMLRSHPAVSRLSAAGSWRRGKEILHDLDFVASSKRPQEVLDAFTGAEFVDSVIAAGKTKASVRLSGSNAQCDLRVVSDAEFPFALNYFTGSKEHNVAMRGRALKRGFTLNEYRLAPSEDGGPAPRADIRTEDDLYRALGLDPIPPELRENAGEIEAAEAGELPELVDLSNLRGTFHNHTVASDGRASLEEMADAARDLGLQYLGIADHSKSSFQANGLGADRLLAQAAEIRSLNKKFGGGFRLFAGTECDILKDGSLDFPDDVLAQLDYVVASVHSVFGLPEAEMTARIIRAIEHPFVTMLGHVSGRLLLRRDAYQVDIPAVIDAAAATGTIIELNSNPYRLDMDWRWWKLARDKGVRCAINPDAHGIEQLQFLFYGIRAARKGWLTRDDVVNCLPLGEIEPVLAAKRSRVPS